MVWTRCHAMPHIPGRPATLSKVQQLFRLSRSLFRPKQVPTERQLNEALQLMRNIPLSELGFDEGTFQPIRQQKRPFFFDRGAEERLIEYFPVYEGNDFDIGIFCLPSGALIPLHDHPGMTVMTRLLYGKMHVRAFDMLPRKGASGRTSRLQLREETVMQEDNCLAYLLPDQSNVHMFRALTPCAILDVLAPPYNPEEGRQCTYYQATEPMEVLEDKDGFLKQEIIKDMPVIEVEASQHSHSPYRVIRGSYSGIQPNVNEET